MWDGSLSVLFSFPNLKDGMKTRYVSNLESYAFLFPLPVPVFRYFLWTPRYVWDEQVVSASTPLAAVRDPRPLSLLRASRWWYGHRSDGRSGDSWQ